MAKVLTHMCMSLDGFVAQPDDSPAELFDWYWNGDVVVPSAQDDMSFSVDAATAPMLEDLTSGCGALIAGRRLFDQADGWADNHPAGAPVVVVTHRPPPDGAFRGGPQLRHAPGQGPPLPGGTGGSRMRSRSQDRPSSPCAAAKTKITAPPRTISAWAAPLSSVAPMIARTTPAARTLGHHRVREVRTMEVRRGICTAGTTGVLDATRCGWRRCMPMASSSPRLRRHQWDKQVCVLLTVLARAVLAVMASQ